MRRPFVVGFGWSGFQSKIGISHIGEQVYG